PGGDAQHAPGGDGRLRREEGVVAVVDDEVDRLRRLVGGAGGDGRGPRRGVQAGVFVDGDVAARGERRRVVHGGDGDGARLRRGGIDAAVGRAAVIVRDDG